MTCKQVLGAYSCFTPALLHFTTAALLLYAYQQGLLLSMCMLVLGSLVAGYNDLKFSAAGYGWMGVNVGE